jgi:hypothetical protein
MQILKLLGCSSKIAGESKFGREELRVDEYEELFGQGVM